MSEPDDFGKSIFRQEAVELVQSIERGLIALEQAPQDRDRLNAVFRDLHTVKGSGAMFGFSELAMFVHEFETAFDGLRRGEAEVNSQIIAISLQACDQILPLLDSPNAAAAESADILARLQVCLTGTDQVAAPESEEEADLPGLEPEVLVGGSPGLHVRFRLGPDAMLRGHDPELLLEDLRALGPCDVRALTDTVPSLDRLDPTACLLGWEVAFAGTVDPEAVEAVFMFTRDSMQLDVTRPALAPALAPAKEIAASTVPSASSLGEVAPAVASPQPEPGRQNRGASSGDTMRVATERLDELMDRVGELVIAETRLHSLARTSGDTNILAVAEDIQRLAAALRDSTMSIRMVPLSSILGRFQRLIRDLSNSLGKPMTFVTQGEDTALDKTVLELLADPLVYLLRN
ncbi:MAG TPA: Hpt domain-containing protein, partial [Tabrizicola sp.]|nr:Hpt domain-containing protein [Tabrizicola sp.]